MKDLLTSQGLTRYIPQKPIRSAPKGKPINNTERCKSKKPKKRK